MKDKILELLKKEKTFVSGQALCEKFNVSRTAVWKAINSLRGMGYEIESVTNKGYRLVKPTDIVNETEIKNFLETKTIGNEIIVLDTVDSTNNYLKDNANNIKDGTVVTARMQTGGKGRLGRKWETIKDEEICFSILLRPDISPMEVSAITPLCGLAVAKGLSEYFDFKGEIKWPNDVIVGSKKICGILTEMNCEFDKVDFIVIGIGINVLNTSFPKEIAYKATSCKMESNREINKNQLLATVLKNLEEVLIDNNYNFTEKTLEEYKSYCATLNRAITFTRKGEKAKGTATDINNLGELIVTMENGEKETVFSGEVTAQGIY